MSDALLLTVAAIPGLFRRGSPVYESGRSGIQGCRGVVVPAARGDYLVIRWEQEARGMETTLTGGAALDLADPTGCFHAILWLQERGHDLRWAEDEAEVLAWSVLSVHCGGRPIAGIKSLVLEEPRRAALADNYALRNPDGSLTLPPLSKAT